MHVQYLLNLLMQVQCLLRKSLLLMHVRAVTAGGGKAEKGGG